MAHLESRLTVLERANAANSGPLLMLMEEEPTEPQRTSVQTAGRGERVVVVLDRLDLQL